MLLNVFEVVWMKTHEGNELWKSICRRYPVLPQNCVLMNEGVLRMAWSCFRLLEEYGMCSTSLRRLVLAAMRVVVQYAKFLLL